MAARPPQLDGEAVAQALAQHSREPFTELMAQMLAGAPDELGPDRGLQNLGRFEAL